MKRAKAVIFPDTVPQNEVLTPLVLVFEPVVYCQPVENDDSGQLPDSLSQKMIYLSLCSIHTPAPLGKNRERFLHLVKGLQQRRDDYAAQLTHVSLAGISSGSQPATESQSSIISNLMSGQGIESVDQEQREKLLWQARLVLKLAEQYDMEQQRVNEEMRTIHEREQKMFSGVSVGENIFHLTGKLATPVADTNKMQRLRLKAWSRLFGFGPNPLKDARVFVSTDPDAVDRLFEECERSGVDRPDPFVTLPLPRSSSDENNVAHLQLFRQEEGALLEGFSETVEEPSNVSETTLEAWNTALDKHFPTSEYGRSELTMYQIPGVRVKQLFLSSFGHDEDGIKTEIANETQQDILIGLLKEL